MLSCHHLFALVETISRQLIALDAILLMFQTVRHLLLINMFPVFEDVIKRVWEIGSSSTVRHASYLCKLKADFLKARASFIIHLQRRPTGTVRQSIFQERVKLVAYRALLSDLKLFLRTKKSANERSATLFRMDKLMKGKQLKSTLSWLKKLTEIKTKTALS